MGAEEDMIDLRLGDCLEVMKDVPDRSVDLCLTDPPYGTTACKWDSVIPFAPMWEQLHRVVKPNGAICLFGSEPFSSALRMSNIKRFKYDWVWNKKKAANFLFGNKMPLKKTEIISIFYEKQPNYFPIKTINPLGSQKSGRKGIGNTIFDHLPNAPKQSKAGKSYEPDKLLPDNILVFSKDAKPVHPTQKPVPLLEYLIKTYTLEGETVLDFTMGSGSTGVACKNLNRKFIGIERDGDYFEIAKKRIL
jgi:DNA modification methylase